MAEAVTRMLADRYRTTTVQTGEAALRFLDRRRGLLTIAVVELQLPGMSGRRLAEIIAERFPEAGVLFLADSPSRLGDPLPGPFLTKPFKAEQLVEAIAQLLVGHRRNYLYSAEYFGHLRGLVEAIGLHDRQVRRHSNRVQDLLDTWHPVRQAQA